MKNREYQRVLLYDRSSKDESIPVSHMSIRRVDTILRTPYLWHMNLIFRIQIYVKMLIIVSGCLRQILSVMSLFMKI